MSFEAKARVALPDDAERILTVFVNSITQVEGTDYRRVGDHLEFTAGLRSEGKLGFWRWLSIFIGIAGTYRQDDSVDVLYERDGKRVLVSKIPIESLVSY